jgi:hypothetical protein
LNKHAKDIPDHLKTHGLRDLALICGVGRERLTRALADAGEKTNQELTVARAVAALSKKFQREDDLARRQKAEADSAEIDAANKKKLTWLKSDVRLMWADGIIRIRNEIQSMDFLTEDQARKILVGLSKIRPTEPDEEA